MATAVLRAILTLAILAHVALSGPPIIAVAVVALVGYAAIQAVASFSGVVNYSKNYLSAKSGFYTVSDTASGLGSK